MFGSHASILPGSDTAYFVPFFPIYIKKLRFFSFVEKTGAFPECTGCFYSELCFESAPATILSKLGLFSEEIKIYIRFNGGVGIFICVFEM